MRFYTITLTQDRYKFLCKELDKILRRELKKDRNSLRTNQFQVILDILLNKPDTSEY